MAIPVPRAVNNGVRAVTGFARAPSTPSVRPRRKWSTRGRAHIEVRGVHRPERTSFARRVERELRAREGVAWAEVNPILGRVAVVFDPELATENDLVDLVDALETDEEIEPDDWLDGGLLHPADGHPLRWQRIEVVADVGGLFVGAVSGLLRIPRLPAELGSVLPALDGLQPVRRLLRRHLGLEAAMVATNATIQGLTRATHGLVVDAAHRVMLIVETTERRAAWERVEQQLHPAPRTEPLEAVERVDRPVPIPPGPLERYAPRAAAASVATAGVALATTLDARRAADVVVAGIPRAARLGRESFSAHVARALSLRDVLVVDERAVRLFDRIDTFVVDDAVLATGRGVLGEVVPVGGHDPTTVRARLDTLFSPEHPMRSVADGDWDLHRIARTDVARVLNEEAADRLHATAATRAVVELRRGGSTVAVATVEPELTAGARDLAVAVHRAAQDLVIAGGPERTAVGAILGADEVRAADEDLAEAVRALQRGGRVVALVSTRPGAALLAADVGVGVLGFGDPPWGADVLCPSLGETVLVADATELARTASRRVVAITGVGSLAATMLAFGHPPQASRRSIVAGNLAALTAIGIGSWTALELLQRPVRRTYRPTDWHALGGGEVLRRVGGTRGGLSSADAARRVTARVDTRRRATVPEVFVEQLASPLTALLGVGAALSVAAGSTVDGLLVASGLAASAGIGTSQRLRGERAIDALTDVLQDRVTRVRRDGAVRFESPDGVVAGDVVVLRAGDVVPADCRVLEASDLEVDESSLTGESLPVDKDPAPVPVATALADRRSMLYAGTSIAVGEAEAVAVAVGDAVEARQGLEAGGAPPPTGVEARLHDLTNQVVPGVVAGGAALVVNGLLRGQPTREAVASGVSLAAAAVPEGLPFLATVAQSSAARRLADRGVLVRNAGVLEALGRVDVLCFDKTGTLTHGELEVRRVDDGLVTATLPAVPRALRHVLSAALRATPREHDEPLPHPTDRAVVDAAESARAEIDDGLPGWRAVADLPFRPSSSYHAVLGRATDHAVLSVKGAPEVVLPRCGAWHRADRGLVPLDAAATAHLRSRADALARGGLRVLAVAERATEAEHDLTEEQVRDLEFVGFVGIADVARSDAVGAIAEMRDAGIDVVMVTGDHQGTAEAIAKEVALAGTTLTGPDLDRLDDDELDRRLPSVSVFARVTPADKVRIVRAYQRAGRVVAMTGDGANDAQAIRLADIGIAFGARATSAARTAADLVVSSGDVATIIHAIAEGRAMWASVRNGLAILLGGNLGEVAFTTGAALVNGRSPLNPRQLLAVNLLTDLAPALAIASRPPTDHSIDAWREGPDASLGSALVRDIGIRAAATAGGAAAAWSVARVTGSPTRASTIALVSLVGTQLGQTLVLGRHEPLVAASAIVSSAALFAIVQTPGVSQFFGCRPLGPVAWSIAATASAAATAGAVVAGAVVARRAPTERLPDGQPAAT